MNTHRFMNELQAIMWDAELVIQQIGLLKKEIRNG